MTPHSLTLPTASITALNAPLLHDHRPTASPTLRDAAASREDLGR